VLLPVFHIQILAGVVYIFYSVINAWRRSVPSSATVFFDLLVIAVAVVHDILKANILIQGEYLMLRGTLLFILILAFALLFRYSSLFDGISELVFNLRKMNKKNISMTISR